MKVAFVQRFFASYQGGLVEALRRSPRHHYVFFGDERDTTGTGIEVYPLHGAADFRRIRTRHLTEAVAWQSKVIGIAMKPGFGALILEGSSWMPSNWVAIVAARLTGKRVILYTHGWLREETGCKNVIRNLFYHLADALLLYGQRGRQIGLRNGFADEKLVVAYNSLDYSKIVKSRDSVSEADCDALKARLFGADQDRPLLVYIGRLTRAKQLGLLVLAGSILAAGGMPVNLLFIGAGPEEPALRAQAAAYGVRIHFAGAMNDEASIAPCLSAADAAVVPGAAGLTVIHCLAYGLPVVIHDEMDFQGPEAEAVKPGRTGFLFRRGDENSLSDAVRETLRCLPRVEATRRNCIQLVEECYQPVSMARIFDSAVEGSHA